VWSMRQTSTAMPTTEMRPATSTPLSVHAAPSVSARPGAERDDARRPARRARALRARRVSARRA
jgi:hypothetical protein